MGINRKSGLAQTAAEKGKKSPLRAFRLRLPGKIAIIG
jgi:hypothetical protein